MWMDPDATCLRYMDRGRSLQRLAVREVITFSDRFSGTEDNRFINEIKLFDFNIKPAFSFHKLIQKHTQMTTLYTNWS